jgi:hypothetical protein
MTFKYIVDYKGTLSEVKEISATKKGIRRFKIINGDSYSVGKTVELWPAKARTMKKMDIGYTYDPNGVEKEQNKAVYFGGKRSGMSLGNFCNNANEATTIIENAKKYSVAFVA